MAEGLSPQLAQEADHLRSSHKTWGDSFTQAEEVNTRARALEHRMLNGDKTLTYQERVFANGGSTQLGAVNDAALHRDANLWRAHEHYQNNREAYEEQARMDAEAAGKEIKLPPVA